MKHKYFIKFTYLSLMFSLVAPLLYADIPNIEKGVTKNNETIYRLQNEPPSIEWVKVKAEAIKPIENQQNELIISKLPEQINIKLDSSVNPILYVTIAIVVLAAIIQIKTINKKTEESLRIFAQTQKIQREISEQETRAKVITENRQKWINTLRDELATLIAGFTQISMLVKLHRANVENLSVIEKVMKITEDLFYRNAKIALLINPKEDDHSELLNKIEEIFKMTSKLMSEGDEKPDIQGKNTEIKALSQKILKREWEEVKKFK